MAKALHQLCITFSILLYVVTYVNANYNVVSFGAKADGQSDSTMAFQKAWAAACSSNNGPATFVVPRGSFVVRPTYFQGPCKTWITVHIKGKIVAPLDYKVLAVSTIWLLFYKVNGITVNGGTIDARGEGYWSCKRNHGNCNIGAQSISFIWCNNVVVDGLTSIDSQRMHVGVDSCQNVVLRHLTLRAPSGSPNTDGIHLELSSGVTIFDSTIKTGDDCISIGPGTKNVLIQRIECGPGHGISIGSLANNYNEDGVQNITVTGVNFWKTENGVRIKSWARPSNGFVHGVTFRNINMHDVYNPIIIDQKYCPSHQCPHQNSGIKITGVKYRNIKGTSATKVAVDFYCSPSQPCRGIRLHDVQLTYQKSSALTACANVHGSNRGTVIPQSCF